MLNDKESLDKLYLCRDQIEKLLAEIESIIQINFESEYSVAYQHWLPQIKTALRDNTRWLPRGQYNMEYTLKRIEDNLANKSTKGVTKYIQ